MEPQKRKAIWMGLLGLILIVLGIKFAMTIVNAASLPLDLQGKPAVLFFNLDKPCECMVELTQRAETQIANWPEERRDSIQVVRIPFEQRRDLQAKYEVFRVPCLILVDAQNQVIWRQDYPLIEGGRFGLEELEAAIADMGSQ
jgi:hypothetical protein